jgi:hypothetical protein
MSFAPLVPCVACRRHVRIDEGRCPFCATELPSDVRPVPNAKERISRGAAMVFASSLAVAGCGGATSTSTTDGGSSDSSTSDSVASDASTNDDVATDTGSISAHYGLPPDSAVDSATGDSATDDADAKDTGGGVPIYGLPPPIDGG